VTKVKNVRPGLLLIADAGLRLAPGETVSVERLTLQMQSALEAGLLARVDVETECKAKSKPASRASAAKSEAREKPARDAADDTDSNESGEVIDDADGSQGRLLGADNDGS